MDETVNMWISLANKVAKSGLQALDPEEMIIFQVFVFVNELEIGGCSGAFYSLSPRSGSDQHRWLDLRGTAELLRSIGDSESARLLLQAADAFERVPEPLPSTWKDFMESAMSNVSTGLWDAIEARVPAIYDHLEAYTRAHLA